MRNVDNIESMKKRCKTETEAKKMNNLTTAKRGKEKNTRKVPGERPEPQKLG